MSDTDLTTAPPVEDIRRPRGLDGVLLCYRALAYTVGTLLVILFCVGLPLQFAAGLPQVDQIVGVLHGFLFIAYLLVTFVLAVMGGWRLTRVALVGLAGLVPFLTFYAERKVTGWARATRVAGPR